MGPEGDDDDVAVRIQPLSLLNQGLVASMHTIEVSDDYSRRFLGNRHVGQSMVRIRLNPNPTERASLTQSVKGSDSQETNTVAGNGLPHGWPVSMSDLLLGELASLELVNPVVVT